MVKPTLSFSEALNASTSKIFDCKGRSRRSEFWWSYLAAFVLSAVLPFLSPLLMLATIPLTIRRLHDTGRSGWWWGVGALLNVGIFIMVFFWLVSSFFYTSNVYEYGNDEFNNMAYENMSFMVKFFIYLAIIYIYRIVLIVFCCQDSEFFENKYGPSPKYGEEGLGDL